MAFEVPPLPYAADALEPHIDAQTMTIHHDKHHQAYVDKLNAALEGTEHVDTPIEEIIANLDAIPEDKRGPVRNNGGGHLNHSLFWEWMSPDGGGEPTGALRSAIDDTFGGFDVFKEHMTQVVATAQGSAWAILSYEPAGKRLFLQQLYTHQDNHLIGAVPLLCIDAWEHAYYLQYENRKTEFFDAFWNVVDWSDVARRYEAARTTGVATS